MSNAFLFTLSSKFIQPQYQLASIAVTVLFLTIILYRPLTEFNTTDTSPNLLLYLPKKQIVGAESVVPVKVGLYISNFPTFDIITNNFIADMILWFEFDPSLLSFDTIQKCTFDRGKIQEKNEPDMKMVNNKLLLKYTMRLKFTTSLNYKLFPLNDHRIFITLKNEYVTPEEVMFTTEKGSFSVNEHANTGDWSIIGSSAQAGYFVSTLDKNDPQKTISFPGVVFSLDIKRMGIRKTFIIILPMAILFFISLITFSIDPKTLGRSILTLSTGALTGLIAYRFVIERIVPDVGYFTFTDHLFNIFLTAIFIIFLV
ncbi:hypothetical protein H0X06_06060 [Candidatus Dependentiae bacterium]|nr:hypothetical protein [Candidatus Dependentiae bacterium]